MANIGVWGRELQAYKAYSGFPYLNMLSVKKAKKKSRPPRIAGSSIGRASPLNQAYFNDEIRDTC
jgi:hypothetical protein